MKHLEIHSKNWDRASLLALIEKLPGRRLLIVGDVGVDRYTIGSVERISPEAPVPIVLVEDEKLKLGLAANVADNVHALGARAELVGLVGRDRCAQDFRDLLKKQKIGAAHLISDASRRTVLKERVVSDRQQLLRVDYESVEPLSSATEKLVLSKVHALLPRVDAVILQDYAKGLITESLARTIFRAARQAGKLVAVDPNSKTPVARYKGSFVLTPNTKEAEKLSGVNIQDQATLEKAGLKILSETAAAHVVITRGKEGMAIFSRKATSVRLIPTYVREVYDVSGAGDTVISVLTLALSAGASIEEAAILGNLAAGVEVGKRGTATVSTDEILAALEFFSALSV